MKTLFCIAVFDKADKHLIDVVFVRAKDRFKALSKWLKKETPADGIVAIAEPITVTLNFESLYSAMQDSAIVPSHFALSHTDEGYVLIDAYSDTSVDLPNGIVCNVPVMRIEYSGIQYCIDGINITVTDNEDIFLRSPQDIYDALFEKYQNYLDDVDISELSCFSIT